MENEQALPETAAGEVAPASTGLQGTVEEFQVDDGLINRTVDAWFNEFFHNSLLSRDAQIFNYCQTAKEELKRRVAAL